MTTQWEMGDLEKVGLLKMDFLGLRNLTLLDNCVKLIERTRGDRHRPAASSRWTTRRRTSCSSAATPRGSSSSNRDGIRDLLKRMKPDNIRDLIAMLRPVPPRPAQRRHGRRLRQRASTAARQPTYPHPVMKEVLEETYGVMVYQEQVMRILNRLGGIELSQAYACIKAISKKKHEIIDAGRGRLHRRGGGARRWRARRPRRSST